MPDRLVLCLSISQSRFLSVHPARSFFFLISASLFLSISLCPPSPPPPPPPPPLSSLSLEGGQMKKHGVIEMFQKICSLGSHLLEFYHVLIDVNVHLQVYQAESSSLYHSLRSRFVSNCQPPNAHNPANYIFN